MMKKKPESDKQKKIHSFDETGKSDKKNCDRNQICHTSFIHNIPVPLYCKKLDGQCVDCNSLFESLTGIKRNDFIQKRGKDIIAENHVFDDDALDHMLLKNGGVQIYESSVAHADGMARNVRLMKSLMRDSKGNPWGVVAALFDVTSENEAHLQREKVMKEYEEVVAELRSTNQELEIKNRELQSTNKQLHKTLKELKNTQQQLIMKEKMASLGGLVAGLAHEINTPLGICYTLSTFIEGEVNDYIRNMEADKLTEEDDPDYSFFSNLKSGMQMLISNIKRSANLVQDFKCVAADQASDKKRFFNFNDYIWSVIKSCSVKFGGCEYDFQVSCDPVLEINSFPGVFSQVLSNLILNSHIHGFSDQRTGFITIAVSVSKGNMELCYSDSGRGLNSDEKRNIFEPFFTTKRGSGCSGLGMHIVYNLVTQKLSGSIGVESTEGQGVFFRIKIPLKD